MFDDLTKEEIEGLLEEYVATATNPKYGGDMDVVNSKFPEFKGVDKGLLEEYLATAENPEYGGDMDIINSKFPEFFEKKEKNLADIQPGDVTTAESTTSDGLDDYVPLSFEDLEGLAPSTMQVQQDATSTELAEKVQISIDESTLAKEQALKKDEEKEIVKEKYAKDLQVWSKEALKQDQEFSWEAGSKPSTVTATPESITVASDPTVKVETSQEVEERHRVNRIEQRKSLSIELQEDLAKMEADEENQLNIFEKRLNQIDLTNETEETIVPALNYLFQDYGFTFEETSISPNAIKITAPGVDRDGNKIERVIDFAEWTQYIDPSGFWSKRHQEMGGREDHETEIADFIRENRDIAFRVDENKQKVVNKEQLDQVTKDFNIEANEYMQAVKELNSEAKPLLEQYETLSPQIQEYEKQLEILKTAQKKLKTKGEEYDRMAEGGVTNEEQLNQAAKDYNKEANAYRQAAKKFDQKYKPVLEQYNTLLPQIQENRKKLKGLDDTHNNLKTKGKEYDTMVGEYAMMRAEGGGAWRQFKDMAKSGVGKLLGFGAELILTTGAYAYSSPLLANMSSAEREKFIKELKYGKDDKSINPYSKTATKLARNTDEGLVEFMEDIVFKAVGRASTEEYLQDGQQADLFSGKGLLNVAFGVTEFLTAAPGGIVGIIALSAQYTNQEMRDNPAFDDVPEWERGAVSLTIGTAVGVLERLGFKNVLKSNPGLVAYFTRNALRRNPGTMKTFNEYVEQEVNSLIKKGALRMLAGGAAEFETGGLQEIADISLKKVYNLIKEGELFETPEDLLAAGAQVLHGATAEAMGGHMLAAPQAFSYALGTNEISEIDDNTFRMLEEMSKDSKYLDLVTSKLEQQVVNQEITKADMDKILTDYNRMNGAMQKMPEGINTKNKKQLLSLFMEHQTLKSKMEKTDDVFNKKNKEELEKIENRIDGVLEANEVEASAQEVLETKPGETQVFYAEKLEDVPEEFRGRANKVEDDANEITFREKLFGLPIGKKKGAKIGEYYTYTLDGAEIKEVAKKKEAKEKIAQKEKEKARTPIATETYESMEEVPSEIKDAAIIIRDKDGKVEVEYKDTEGNAKVETFDSKENIPEEIIDADAVITEMEDGSLSVDYKEDEVSIESPDITETFDSKEAIPQAIIDVVGEENIVEEDGKFTVTYKETDVLGATLEAKKKEAEPVATEDVDLETQKAEIEERREEKLKDNEYKIVEEVHEVEFTSPDDNIHTAKVLFNKDGSGKLIQFDENGERIGETKINKRLREVEKDNVAKIVNLVAGADAKVISSRKTSNEKGSVENKINAKYDAELDALDKKKKAKKKEAPVQEEADIEAQKAKIEKRLNKQKETLTSKDSNVKHHAFNNIGEEYEEGMNVTVRNFKDNSSSEVTGVEVITQVYSSAEIDKDGVQTKPAEVEVTRFNSIEDANKYIKEEYDKQVGLIKKTEKELAALEKKSKKKEDPQFQLETQKQTEGKKKELVESAIKQMEEVLPETAQTVEAPEAKKVIPIVIKKNTKLAKKLKKVGLGFLVGKKINLVMADQLKVSDDYMGGPFFPLINSLFGKVAWASMNNTAGGSIINGAIDADYSVVFNMSPTAVFSNKAFRQEILKNLSPQKQKQLYNLIQNSDKFKATKKSKYILEKSKNLEEMFALMDSKDKKVKFNVEDKIKFFNNLVPTQGVQATSDVFAFMQKNGLNMEQILPNVQEQFAKDLPMGALTTILEVRVNETKTYDSKSKIPKEIKDDPGTTIVKTNDNKYEVTYGRRINQVVAEINEDVSSGRITEKEGKKRIQEARKNALITKEQQKAEGLKPHPNYAVYIRGRAVALLKETVPFWDVLASYKEIIDKKIAGQITDRDSYSVTYKGKDAKALVKVKDDGSREIEVRVNSKKVKGFSIPSENNIAIETYIKKNIGPIKGLTKGKKISAKAAETGAYSSGMVGASRVETAVAPAKDAYQRFVEKISKAFPGVEVVASQKEFDALVADINNKQRLVNGQVLTTKNQNIYGAVYEGKLYLNPALRNYNTPVHEFGHIWLNTAKAMKSELYNKGIDLIKKDSTYVDQVKANEDYKRVIKRMREAGVSQADIDQYINEEALATAIGDKGESFATAAIERNFKAWLTDLFNFVKKLTGISKLTATEVQNLNLDEFLQGVVVDIMSENPLFKKAELSNFSNQLQLMASDGTNFTIGQIVKIGRQEGFSDSAIKNYLKSKGHKVAKINDAMAIKVDMFTQVPDMFNTVFEGRPEGLKFFNNIRNKINNWTRTRWGKGKSFSEFRAKAMEILMESDVFKAQSKTNQEKLIMGMDSFIGRKSAKDAAAPIQSIKNTVELLKKSDWENNIPKAQKSLRLATKPITATKMHKEKGTKIHKLINNLNKKNYQESIKKIDDLLTEIISDDKQITVKTNADLRKLKDKMTSYYKMLDYAKVKGETSKVIKEIKTVAQALTRNIGKENKDIIAKILSASKSMNTDNAGVAIPEIVEALNELYFKLKTQNQTTAQLARAVKSLKEQVQRRKEQAKNLAEIKTKLTKEIKEAIILLRDLDVKDYRYSAVQRILGKVNNANINNIAAVSAQVANIFSGITESHRKKKLVQIKKFIKEHAKTKRDSSGKIKAKKAVGAFGQEFFAAFDKFLALVEKNKETPTALYNAINERQTLKSAYPDEKGYQDALNRMGESSDAEQVLTKKHIAEIDKILKEEDTSPYVSVVPELAIGLNSMTLDQLNNFFENDLKQKKIEFTKYLQEKLQIEKEARDKLQEQAIKQTAQEVPDMFSENQAEVDGVTEMYKVLKTDNEIGLEGKKIQGIKKAIKKIKENINTTTMFGGVQLLGTLSTICNNLDNLPNGRDFFTENIYKRLNRAFSRFTKGVQDQKAVFDQIAQSIHEDLDYKEIKKLIFKTPALKITVLTPKSTSPGQQKKIDKIKAEIKKLNKKNRKENKQEIQAKKDEITRMSEDLAASRKKHNEVDFKADELMRIYALCKNEDQRAKLKKQGITDDVLAEIEMNLGEDLTAFVDGIVEYLSNDYYNSVNGVYSDVNNVNLTKIPNYFPTKTESINSALTAIKLSDSDQFGAAFSAQFASSLKERTDRGGDVSFFDSKYKNYTFTSELENHIGSSERFKAYAHDVKVINSIARNPVVATLLKRTGLAKLTNTIINNEINPISNSMHVIIRHMFSAYVGKQIGFKPMQFLKQSTSAILSFPKYTNNLSKNLPREAEIAANTVLYSYDQAKVYGQPWKWRSIIKEAMEVSPLFRDRIESFKGRGGYAAMETSINDTEENNRFWKWVRNAHRLGAIPTMAGDIMGVLGYWAVYKRDLANGMSPTKALEKFEDYNKTQQTKRGTELNIIQIESKSGGIKGPVFSMLTTFNSTIFLMSSLVLESVNNMGKIIAEPKTNKGKIKAVRKAILSSDGLNFIFAMGLGNAAFTFMSNIAKVLYGDDDDYEEVLERTEDAMMGYNLLYNIPIIGIAFEELGKDEGSYITPTEGVNPVHAMVKEWIKASSQLEDDELSSAYREILFEYGTGINLDFFKGVMDYVNDENPEQRGYKVAGVSNWYRPRN